MEIPKSKDLFFSPDFQGSKKFSGLMFLPSSGNFADSKDLSVSKNLQGF